MFLMSNNLTALTSIIRLIVRFSTTAQAEGIVTFFTTRQIILMLLEVIMVCKLTVKALSETLPITIRIPLALAVLLTTFISIL